MLVALSKRTSCCLPSRLEFLRLPEIWVILWDIWNFHKALSRLWDFWYFLGDVGRSVGLHRLSESRSFCGITETWEIWVVPGKEDQCVDRERSDCWVYWDLVSSLSTPWHLSYSSVRCGLWRSSTGIRVETRIFQHVAQTWLISSKLT